jgi:hypothetical protein
MSDFELWRNRLGLFSLRRIYTDMVQRDGLSPEEAYRRASRVCIDYDENGPGDDFVPGFVPFENEED